jgi:hypothetical protein
MGRIYTMDWRPRLPKEGLAGHYRTKKQQAKAEARAAKAAAADRQPYQLAVGSDDNYLRVYVKPSLFRLLFHFQYRTCESLAAYWSTN